MVEDKDIYFLMESLTALNVIQCRAFFYPVNGSALGFFHIILWLVWSSFLYCHWLQSFT